MCRIGNKKVGAFLVKKTKNRGALVKNGGNFGKKKKTGDIWKGGNFDKYTR
jgi:hypothetical protein